MIDLDVRALQVRQLDDLKLAMLHRLERERGQRFSQQDVARWMVVPSLKAAYGVPNKPKPLRAWGKTVREVLGRFLRERQLTVNLEDLDSLHAFDRAVALSDVDFQFSTATPAKKARPTGDWFSRSERP